MRGSFSVKNYAKYQHYKDRNPIWIKLYNELLADYEFSILPDASKFHLIGIFLLASRYENRIPFDAIWVAKQINATTTVDLTLLSNAGFIVIELAVKGLLAQNENLAIPEIERENKEEIEKNLSDKSDPSKPEPQPAKRKSPYPEAFEAFWREFPTDALMSKKKAYEQWKRFSETDREAARAAIPAFKDYCRKNTTYRPVHAQRFLSERRFDGFKPEILDPAVIEANKDRADRLMRRGKYAPEQMRQ